MFIELTDLLRCPAEHEEAYLVLLPERVVDRSVVTGELGCPVCGRVFAVADGVVRFGGKASAPGGAPAPLDADGVHAFLGLDGPGGYLVLAGAVGAVAPELAALLAGVHVVAVNPPDGVPGGSGVSILHGDRIPMKRATVRGVVLSAPQDSSYWLEEAMRVVLPGLRIVGTGAAPSMDGLGVLAQTGDVVWVARREGGPPA